MDAALVNRFVRRMRRWSLILRALGVVAALLACAGEARGQTLMIARAPTGEDVQLPLVEESLRIDVDQQHATTVVRRVYDNRSSQRLEGQFTYRSGDGVNVAGFAYWNGDQKIVGEVLETGAARQVYTSTVRRKRDPGLLEKTGEGSFSFKVFPIEPGERKRVELTLDQWLARRDRVVEYRIPVAHPTAEVEIALRDDRKIRKITSTTHAIEATGVGTGLVRVRVRPRGAGDARELALRWELADAGFSLHAHAHRDAGQLGYVVLSLAAPPVAADPGQDVTILLDATATMRGEAFAQARLAAARIVRRLAGVDRFNLVVLEGDARSLYPAPRWATKSTREEAINLLRDAREGRPGDLGRGLAHALAVQENTPRHKTIIVLSDGRSGARRALEIAAQDHGSARVFTVGFGPAVDRPALARLASQKRGRFTLVPSAEALEGAVDRLAKQIAAPGLTHLTLEAHGGALREVYPRALPDLFPGQELLVLGRIDGDGRVRLTLRADAQGGRPVALTTTVDLPREPRRPWIGKLWARERVGDLLEEIALSGEREDRRRETIELALAYNIVTPYTSFLAIPASEILTADAAATLAEARRRKAAVLAQTPDAVALGGAPGESMAAPAPVMAAPPEDPPMPAPPASIDRMHGRGCAGCHVGGDETPPHAVLLAAIAMLALGLRRRR